MNNITVLNFNPLANGNCTQICHRIQKHYAKANIRLFDISMHVSPCGCCDYECLRPGKICPQLSGEYNAMMDRICGSNLVYYAVPNFCGMPNSIYYAFNERSVGYFNMDHAIMEQYLSVKKKFIVVSNTQNNTFTEALHQQTENDPEIQYMKTSRYGTKSIDGDMMKSAEAQADLTIFLSEEAVT